MWFLIPLAIGGGLILQSLVKKSGKEKLNEDSILDNGEIKIEYRRVYICHSYYDSTSYNKLAKKLKMAEDFRIFNHSIPEKKKKHNKNDEELRAIFRKQMGGCSHVFVLASSDIPRKSYVKIELEIAKELGKEIIAVVGKDQYNIPPFIKKLADIEVTNDTRNLKKQLKK
ncbi:hypothetical protein EMA8858_02307 [Emticicia aquatica]|uniref:Thoeris protein ThsB TIR-like domain-containing protein n=1 Tax=Emticicia aquatica TaxID=1681835 RepID=A0ABN8ET17_9BACT|nr:TIR domain-containing protein [Emticicia aquatica]CAH0996177.1 hypothetical protein EMA8858_02307 [Emticicia aquatica]